LAYLAEFHAVPVRRNSSNHLENPLLDLVLADARTLETRYRSSLLLECERTRSTVLRLLSKGSRQVRRGLRGSTLSRNDRSEEQKLGKPHGFGLKLLA